ncbi:hypothetical protein SteCoe_18220 [Stentor coeruleus]|uniref:Uncharacterized protein n=1 Tax=Stentor coeruleus TaxID=5963 RepID=A0A1R2BX31_9CILI|nr:hypothetical protein SteCoe_18220 [Stentor coeruleus]
MGTGKSTNTQISVVDSNAYQNNGEKNTENFVSSETNVLHIGNFRQTMDKKQLPKENSKNEMETSRSNKRDDLIEENL